MKTRIKQIASQGTDWGLGAVVQHTTRTVLTDLHRWTQTPAASRHLIDSAEVFDAACALRDAIQRYVDTLDA